MEENDEKHKFTRQEIEQHLQSALAAATPNVWAKLDLSVPQDKPPRRFALLRLERRVLRWGAAAACICLLAGGKIYHYEYVQVASVVGIDVNPSLRISLNRREQVVKAEALNPDGKTVLDGELKGKTLETALGQVVDSLVEKGYLKEGQQEQAVLVSVSGKNKEKAEKVKTTAAANMEDAIAQKQVSAVVYDQTIQVTKELEELAQTYQVSVGKAGFIEQLVQENEVLNQDSQAAYAWMMNQPMEAIAQEISENAYSVSTEINIIRVEPAGGAAKQSSHKGEPKEALDEKPDKKSTEAEKAEEKSSGEDTVFNHSLDEKEEENSETEKEETAPEKTKDNHEDTRENQKKPVKQEETEPEDARKDKDLKENQETADKPKEKPDAKEHEDREEKTEEPDKEATSSTVGAETAGKEEGENADNAEDGEDNPEEIKTDKNYGEPFAEYGQPALDKAGQEELVVGGDLLGYDPINKGDNVNSADKGGTVEEDESQEAENREEDAESEEADGETAGSTDDSVAESGEADEETAGSTDGLGAESGEADEETAGSTDGSDAESGEADEETAGSTDGSDAESGRSDGETAESTEDVDGSTTASKETDEGTDHFKAEIGEPGKEGAAQTADEQEAPEKNTEEQQNEETGSEVPEKESEVQEAQKNNESLKEGEGNKTATQIIRVKVEKKEWKEPEKPVFASQFLGFSHRRLLTRGPGAFDFILANPVKLKEKGEFTQESFRNDLDENEGNLYKIEDDPDENEGDPDETENDPDEFYSDSYEDEDYALDDDWAMGEWLHIGPGFLK